MATTLSQSYAERVYPARLFHLKALPATYRGDLAPIVVVERDGSVTATFRDQDVPRVRFRDLRELLTTLALVETELVEVDALTPSEEATLRAIADGDDVDPTGGCEVLTLLRLGLVEASGCEARAYAVTPAGRVRVTMT